MQDHGHIFFLACILPLRVHSCQPTPCPPRPLPPNTQHATPGFVFVCSCFLFGFDFLSHFLLRSFVLFVLFELNCEYTLAVCARQEFDLELVSSLSSYSTSVAKNVRCIITVVGSKESRQSCSKRWRACYQLTAGFYWQWKHKQDSAPSTTDTTRQQARRSF